MDELAKQAIAGDLVAEAELFQKLLVRFRRFAEQKVGSEEAAEVAQMACIVIHRKYREEAFSVSFSAWAYGVYRNTLLKTHEHGKKAAAMTTELNELLTVPAEEPPTPRLREFLMSCWRRLFASFPKYARIVNLKYQGYATDEVCSRVGLSKEQYYVYLGRGRSLLRTCLKDKGVDA